MYPSECGRVSWRQFKKRCTKLISSDRAPRRWNSLKRKRLIGRFDIDAPPDFIAEIVASDSGRRRAIAREAEYGKLGVPEVWRIDMPRQVLSMLRLSNAGYTPVFQPGRGIVVSTKIRGLQLRAEWLWMPEDERPAALKIVQRLLRRSKR